MPTNTLQANDLELIELELAQHKAFGASPYIHEQMQVAFIRGLNKIAVHLPAARELLDTLDSSSVDIRYRVLGDTTVRCAITHALTQLTTDYDCCLSLTMCEQIFHDLLRQLAEGSSTSPLQSGVPSAFRLGAKPYHGWVWTEEHPNDIFAQAFRAVVQDNYHGSLYTPDADELNMLANGTRLLEELLPCLSASALSHAHVVAVFPRQGRWTGRGSSSEFNLTGTIFLTRGGLQNPWWVAEHLFHEALHQKMYDFRHGHSLLQDNFWREGAPRICSLWNEPSKGHNWDIHRAIAAFHVYVHLGLLCTIAEQRAAMLQAVYGPLEGMVGSRKAIERAYYLGEQIQDLGWQELGVAGQYFVKWLMTVLETFLDTIGAVPPPKNAYVHLMLDRYSKEARKVELLLSRRSYPCETEVTGVRRRLNEIISEEVRTVSNVLASSHANEELSGFTHAAAQYSEADVVVKFVQVRKLISTVLSGLSQDGYTFSALRGSPRPEEILKRMVERSSGSLDAILAKSATTVAS
jgi:hypothetical protein